MQQISAGGEFGLAERCLASDRVLGDTFDPMDWHPAVVGDVGGLGSPWRQGAQPRGYHDGGHLRACGRFAGGRAVSEQAGDSRGGGWVEFVDAGYPVDLPGADRSDRGDCGDQALQQGRSAEQGEGVAAFEAGQYERVRRGHGTSESGLDERLQPSADYLGGPPTALLANQLLTNQFDHLGGQAARGAKPASRHAKVGKLREISQPRPVK